MIKQSFDAGWESTSKVAPSQACCSPRRSPSRSHMMPQLAKPVVTAPIIGPRTPEQLDATLRALEITMSKQTLEKLGKIFPRSGGAAPEAYAW